MEEIKSIKLLKVFKVNNYEYCNYYIYFMENDGNYEIYLKNKHYGDLMYLYGVPKEQQPIDYLYNNNNFDEFIQEYQEKYED